MLKRISEFFGGVRHLYATKEAFVLLANEMMKRDIRYSSLKAEGDGRSFEMTELEYSKLRLIENFEDYGVITRKRKGIPYIFSRYKRRYGILIGTILLITITRLSTSYVWDIRIEGNDRISDAEISENLKELGFGIGSKIKSTDFYNICHRLLLLNDKISWVSVNMEGTYAVVKLIERSEKDVEGDNQTPSNLVAQIDGEIVRTETEHGQLEVSHGQKVKEGELLISGVMQIGKGDSGRFMLVRSKGRVFAKTKRTFVTEIPLESVQSVFKTRKILKKSLIFFGKSLKLKENYSILTDKCDIITLDKRVVLFEGTSAILETPLPISVYCEYADIYEDKHVTYTEEEALLIAENEMARRVAEILPDAELVSKNSRYEIIDSVLVLTWEIECIENIAFEVPIGVV